MLLHRGSIESLGESLAGYHCNHNREPTVYHGTGKVANDLERFVVSVDRPELPAQRDTWGLADDALEEVAVRERAGPRSRRGTGRRDSGARRPSNAVRRRARALRADVRLRPRPAVRRRLARGLAVRRDDRVRRRQPRSRADARNARSSGSGSRARWQVAELRRYELGGGARPHARTSSSSTSASMPSLSDASRSPARDHEPAQLPARLVGVFDALERLVELERARLERGEHPRRFVLVHSWTVFWDAYVLANLDCSHTTAHSRVRRATVRPVPVDDEATRVALRARAPAGSLGRPGRAGAIAFTFRPEQAVELADLTRLRRVRRRVGPSGRERVSGRKGRVPSSHSRSTGSGRATTSSRCRSAASASSPMRLLKVEALVNGERAAAREFSYGDPEWHIELPASALAEGEVDLSFEDRGATDAARARLVDDDDRPLGVALRTMTLLPAGDDAARAGLARERRLLGWAARARTGDAFTFGLVRLSSCPT